MASRGWLLVACLLALAAVTGSAAHAGVFQCGSSDSLPEGLATSANEVFLRYRFGENLYSSLRSRDLEFFWPAAYDDSLTEAVKRTLQRYAGSLVDKYPGSNAMGYDMSRLQMVYNYIYRPSSRGPYSETPSDTMSVAFGDSARILARDCDYTVPVCYMPSDLCHIDVYLSRDSVPVDGRSLTAMGVYRAYYRTADEDVSNRPLNTGVRHVNSIGIKMPPSGERIDTTGTGWAGPTGCRSLGFGHEVAHGMPQSPSYSVMTEQFSAIAEALTGANDSTETSDFAYTWSLLGYGSKDTKSLRGYGSYYSGRSAFGAYLVYNFPGADTSLTLSGMQDDLAHEWLTLELPPPGLGTLRNLLGDATCHDCAHLLDPPGVPQSDTSRLALLHHYWRAANYVNNPTLDRGQYGYPSRYGFTPGGYLNAWQGVNGVSEDDVVTIPPEITVGPTVTRDTVLYGMRSRSGSSYPLVLQLFGSEYWIVRSDPALAASPQDLVIRMWSDSLGRFDGVVSGEVGGQVVSIDWRRDGWVTASVVGYSEQNELNDQPAELWRHPEWAASVIAPQRMDTDSLRGGLEFIVPNFGGSTKAVLVPITLADGPSQGFQQGSLIDDEANQSPFPYAEVAPYTLQLMLRPATHEASNPVHCAAPEVDEGETLSFAPDGRRIAYGHDGQIYVTDLDSQSYGPLVYSRFERHHPDWSPRGDIIAYESYLPPSWVYTYQAILLHNLETEEVQPLRMAGQGDDFFPCFSPNGQQVAYVVSVDSQDRPWQLRCIDVSGGNDTVLVQSEEDRILLSPRWSSDGRWIYFVAGDSLYAANCDSPGVVVSRTEVAPHVASFDMRPSDGHLIMEEPGAVTYGAEVFNEQWETVSETRLQPFRRIAVRDTTRRLSIPWFYRTGAQYYAPRWSPDGTRIAYCTDENVAGPRDLYFGQVSYNQAPQFVNAPKDTVLAGACDATLVQSWSATDADGEAVTFEAAYLPTGATVSAGGQLTWLHPGPDIRRNQPSRGQKPSAD